MGNEFFVFCSARPLLPAVQAVALESLESLAAEYKLLVHLGGAGKLSALCTPNAAVAGTLDAVVGSVIAICSSPVILAHVLMNSARSTMVASRMSIIFNSVADIGTA